MGLIILKQVIRCIRLLLLLLILLFTNIIIRRRVILLLLLLNRLFQVYFGHLYPRIPLKFMLNLLIITIILPSYMRTRQSSHHLLRSFHTTRIRLLSLGSVAHQLVARNKIPLQLLLLSILLLLMLIFLLLLFLRSILLRLFLAFYGRYRRFLQILLTSISIIIKKFHHLRIIFLAVIIYRRFLLLLLLLLYMDILLRGNRTLLNMFSLQHIG